MKTQDEAVQKPTPVPDAQYAAGSEGSRVHVGNDRKYQGHGVDADLDMHSPAETDHPYVANPVLQNNILDDSPEMVRRKNAYARDCRTGFKVTENHVYATPEKD